MDKPVARVRCYIVECASVNVSIDLPRLVEAPTVINVTCTHLDVVWSAWSPSSDIGSETLYIASYMSVYHICVRCKICSGFVL